MLITEGYTHTHTAGHDKTGKWRATSNVKAVVNLPPFILTVQKASRIGGLRKNKKALHWEISNGT